MRFSHECITVETESMARKWRMKTLGMAKYIPGFTVDSICGSKKCVTPEHTILKPLDVKGGKYAAIATLIASLNIGDSIELNYLPNSLPDINGIRGGVSAHTVARQCKFRIDKKDGPKGVKITRTGTY